MKVIYIFANNDILTAIFDSIIFRVLFVGLIIYLVSALRNRKALKAKRLQRKRRREINTACRAKEPKKPANYNPDRVVGGYISADFKQHTWRDEVIAGDVYNFSNIESYYFVVDGKRCDVDDIGADTMARRICVNIKLQDCEDDIVSFFLLHYMDRDTGMHSMLFRDALKNVKAVDTLLKDIKATCI